MPNETIPTRLRILNAARSCFAQQGFHSTSMKTICQLCGMSPGTLYHHFSSKEALIQAIILEDQERALMHFRDPLQGVKLVDYLVGSMIEVTREEYSQRALVVEIMAEGMRNPQVADMLNNKYQVITASLVERFCDAQQRGEIGQQLNKQIAASLLLAITYGVLASSDATQHAQDSGFATTFRDMLQGMLRIKDEQ